MAFHLHLIDPLRDVVPVYIVPEASAPPRLALDWYVGEDNALRSRWTRVRD